MAIVINGSGTVTGLAVGGLPDGTVDEGTLATDSVTAAKIPAALENTFVSGRRNILINGAMKVAQRGTSTADGNGYGVDRFRGNVANMDNLVVALTQNSVTDLPQFTKSLKVTTNTAESAIAANEYYRVFQQIESQDCQQFAYGTSSAKSVTISFWVKSSITGTYALSVYADASAGSRIIGGTYAIGSANTWEKKTITLAGDTGRVMDNDNTEGFRINWIMAAGTDYTSANNTSWGAYANNKLAYGQGTNAVITTANATWEVTGVQLELGSTATDFETRSYGEELALCHRYYWQPDAGVFYYLMQYNEAYKMTQVQLPVTMRVSPSVTYTVNDGSGYGNYNFSPSQISVYKNSAYDSAGSWHLLTLKVDSEL